jgi:hypothetical protein
MEIKKGDIFKASLEATKAEKFQKLLSESPILMLFLPLFVEEIENIIFKEVK